MQASLVEWRLNFLIVTLQRLLKQRNISVFKTVTHFCDNWKKKNSELQSASGTRQGKKPKFIFPSTVIKIAVPHIHVPSTSCPTKLQLTGGLKHPLKVWRISYTGGTTVINCNCMHEEIKDRMKPGNGCYRLIQKLSSFQLLPKSINIKT